MTTLQIVCNMNEDKTEDSKEEENIEEEPKEGEHKEEEIKEEQIIMQEPKEDKIEKEDSKESSKTESQKEEKKEIYFIIFYSSDQKENPKDMVFCEECEILPKIILCKEIKINNDKIIYKKVLKFNNSKGIKKAEFSFYLGQEVDKYFITFEIESKTFIYDVVLKKRNKYLENIPKININQKSMEYQDKLDLFYEALKLNKEENKFQELYFETIELYSKKSSFSFLISLFSKIYQEKKSCNLLLNIFYEMNANIGKEKYNITNSDKDAKLGDRFNSLIVKISEDSENYIKSNGYNPIHFYGILVCYLNYYDYNAFENCINKLYREKSKILYEIILVYYSHFINALKKDESDKNFFINFCEYIISEKDFSYFTIGLQFISYIDTFITVINKTKEKIYNKYIEGKNNKVTFKSIELKETMKLKKEKIKDIILGIESINKYSKDIKNLLVYFKSNFWKKSLLEEFSQPEPKSFKVCYELRDIFIKYSEIIKSICDKGKDKDIIEDIIDFQKKDEFAYILNDNLKKYFKAEKGKIKNSEILGFIQEYNPYYKEQNYKYKREAYILDDLVFEYDINNEDEDAKELHKNFIETFKKLEYEDIFKDNLGKFIDLMVKKITDISSFDTVIDLISIDKIQEKVNEYLEKLKNKFETKIKPELGKLSVNKQKRTSIIIAKFEKLIFEHENNNDFLRNSISKLEISPLIYNQLIIQCKDDKYKIMKDFIYQEFLNNINKVDSIIELIDILEIKDKEKFLKELMKKCKFTADEFYSKRDNNKINLLYALYKNKKIEKASGDIKTTLNYIFSDIDEQEIDKKKLEEFLGNPKEIVKRRLALVKLYLDIFEPENSYDKLKRILDSINNDIKELSNIKTLLSIFQRERYQNEIVQMVKIINELEFIKIKDYYRDTYCEPIEKLKALGAIAKQVESFKGFLLFRVIYENTKGNNQEVRFNTAKEELEKIKDLLAKEKPDIDEIYKQNKETFDIIKRKLINNEKRSKEFFESFKKYFNIGDNKENKELMDDLTLLFNSKKYELYLKSIIYFFNIFEGNNEISQILLKEYQKLSELSLKDLKVKLKELKDIGIYDYQTKNNYSKFFTSLYGKKEAIDFLISKINTDINELYDRIDPNSPTITIQKIDDTKICIEVFNQFKKKKNYYKIFEYIKNLNKNEINAFESYSKVFSSIIKLDRNENSTLNIFTQVDNIIHNAKFEFAQEIENFSYGEGKKITMNELIHLKNKINIMPQDENMEKQHKKKEEKSKDNKTDKFEEIQETIKIKEEKEEDGEKEKEKEKQDILKIKSKKLSFYKNLVNNMEVIYQNMQILRAKGNNLPIDIKIIVQYDKNNQAEYYLDKNKSNFENIETFLLNSKDDYLKKLDLAYKGKMHIRYFYGNLFRRIVEYLDGESFDRIIDIFRYILNKNNDEEIKEITPTNPQIIDYVKNYTDYNTKSFENIYNSLIALFDNNKSSLKKHYEAMSMLENNKYKGIYLYECDDDSTGKTIYQLFLQKIGQKPIAQNILINSKETSIEEIQAFLYRSILCDYNTLFVVEINESMSDYKQGIMYNVLDELLIYKMERYKSMNKGINFDKAKTSGYLDACIVFIFEQKNKDLSILNEIGKLDKQDIQIDSNITISFEESDKQLDKLTDISNISNIIIITSDKCGLGKSFKIKKMVENKNQKYFHFPLGGILTKKIISRKILNLLEKIKNENEKDKKDIKDTIEKKENKNAIHLDLTESEETNLINEFLFSFLITRFYNNNETIIYIPKDIDIYIEIPNCFNNYLSKFGILRIFNKENITIENKPKLDLQNDMIYIFNKLLGLNSNEAIEKEFLEKYLGDLKNYSYHQIIIFIKLFISQFNKLHFIKEQKDINEKCIYDFAKSVAYFIDNGFQNLIMKENLKKENKDYADLLSEAYSIYLNGTKFDIPFFYINEENMIYEEFKIKDEILDNKRNSSKDYLLYMKKLLDIPNEVENEQGELKSLLSILNYETDNYIITKDNFTKMILLAYRIIADIPVIIMGETGCGKTELVIKLNQILNNGEKVIEIINIHQSITDKYLCKKMEEMNEKAKQQKKELWVFFDHINTCLSLSLLTEIFMNKTFYGKKIENNIRLIGSCNPYRRRKAGMERYGYGRENENDKKLVYSVQPFPQSLLNYVLSFGTLDEENEKNYIYRIIEKLFEKGEEKLHEETKEVIFSCHKYLRDTFDPSVVSLREISRLEKIVHFFQQYFLIKRKCEEKNDNNYTIENNKIDTQNQNINNIDKIISIICSVYISYYIRLTDNNKRVEFNNNLRESLINLVNSVQYIENIKANEKVDKDDYDEIQQKEDLTSKIQNYLLKSFMQENGIKYFSDFLRLEEIYLLDKIEVEKGIEKNDLLKENLFSMFVTLITKIPLIIVGKPGTGKSLSSQLIYNSMRGEYSKDKFFRQFPQILLTNFQGSKSTKPEDIEKLFEIAQNKLEFYKGIEKYKDKLPISMILFDNLGLAEKSESNPLKVLHYKLEYTRNEKEVCFIGISNYTLDVDKMNRAMNLSVPNLEEKIDQLISTSLNIVESISEDLNDTKIFEILSRTYYEYKKKLILIKELIALKQYDERIEQLNIKKSLFMEIKMKKEFKNLLRKEKKIKEDFHSNRDLFNYIRGIASRVAKLGNINEIETKIIINNCIERNFGGINYEFDINLDLKLLDIETEIESLKEILREKISGSRQDKKLISGKKKKVKIKERNNELSVTSVYLFKKIYNMVCENLKEKSYQLENKDINEYDLNRCIINNISDSNSRYLLLEIASSLESLIYQNIRIQNPEKDIVIIDGSPFDEDDNNEYKFEKLREIQLNANTENLVIMKNLNQIQPFLYDLYNMNYIIKDEEKCFRIFYDNFNEFLTPVKDSFRIIILVDRKFMRENDFSFLNYLEKIKISFDKLLDDKQKVLARKIITDINFKKYIELHKINYELKDLLINCEEEDIQGLVYNEMRKNNNKLVENIIKEAIHKKIVKIASQDIIAILPENNEIKKLYLSEKKYYNLKSYINDLDEDSCKISIIYTFNSIAVAIDGVRIEMKFLISNIRMENQLERAIKEVKYQNEKVLHTNSNDRKNKIIYISFDQLNSNKIQFVSEYIKKNYKNDDYRYIFIIHIQRNFKLQMSNMIYSIQDIDPDIEQLFIDNLNGPNIMFKNLLNKNIQDIMNENSEYMNLNNEFNRFLANFVYKELTDKRNQNAHSFYVKDVSILKTSVLDNPSKKKDNIYSKEISRYMETNYYFKEKIIFKALKFLSEDKTSKGDSQKLIDKILHNNYICKNTLDIISCILNYIKEEIFGKFIRYIFSVLEDNNILTTLIEIQNNKNNEISETIIKKLLESSLEAIIYDDKKEYNPKFLYDYKIPGFYNSYKKLSDYIDNSNIIIDYYNCEKNLRKYEAKANVVKKSNELYKKEKELLSLIYEYFRNEVLIIFDNIGKIDTNIILKDYIYFYLDKYDLKSETNNNLIELLLKLRFNPQKNSIIKENSTEPIKITLMKIIWIESNANYITNILNIYSYAEKLYYNKEKLFEMVKSKINDKDKKIKYIVNETRNPEYTREVNECYYILLASICLCLTGDEMELSENVEIDSNIIEIKKYLEQLTKINLSLQDLNTNLNLSLNEMYIIDELIKIIELQILKNINIQKIKEIRKLLRENASIIQKDSNDKYSKLIVNFENIYQIIIEEKLKEIKSEEDKVYQDKFYDTLKYIYLKEITKIIEGNYRNKIFEKIIRDNEIIKRSGDILQILLKKVIKTTTEEKNGFSSNLNNLKKGNEIVNLIENNLLVNSEDNYFSLQEMMLSFFEKSSLIYLGNVLENKKFRYIDESTPLDIFEDCVKFLVKYNFSKKLGAEIRHIRKLFCIGYIKVYCYTFFKMINENNPKLKDPLSIERRLERLSEKENKMNELIRLYIYKTIFNQNGKQLDVFLNENKKKFFNFEKYKGFKDFFKIEEKEKINFGFETVDENYDIFYNKIEKYKENGYKDKIIKDEIIEGKVYFIDNFINVSNILILSKLKNKDYDISEEYENYYNNICKPLFEGEEQLFVLIEYLFNPEKYEELKNYGFNPTNIDSLFFGFRYCLNCFSDIQEDDEDKIYATLYDKNKISYLTEKCYPGSNPKYEPKYELFNQITNHFKNYPNEGCFICLCEKGYYHSVPSGFPGDYEKNKKCPNCDKPIGSEYIEEETGKKLKIIKRDGYVRIFKDEDEIEKIKEDSGRNKKLQEINYMTINKFKEDYIKKLYKDDKGLHTIEENYFKKRNKYVRNLSQISYRLLNYILYSHLFFARLYTGVSGNFDKYLPEKKSNEDNFNIFTPKMSWGETLNECWNLLKEELNNLLKEDLKNKDINFIEIFMNFTFKDLYYKLNGEECINDYESLILFENKLEELIQKKVKLTQVECTKYKELIYKNSKNKDSFVNLLKEKYDNTNYDWKKYPNYDNFYYTNYLDEENISKLLEGNNKNKESYLILNKYLHYDKNKKRNESIKKKDEKYYSLDNLYMFISVLNLFSEKYSHEMTKEIAESKILADDEIYQQNETKIEKFIKFFNKLQESEHKEKKVKKEIFEIEEDKDDKEKENENDDENEKNNEKEKEDKDYLKLSATENHLADILLDPENKYGKAYKIILQKFIERQNNELYELFETKINDGKMDANSIFKIYVQQIKENDVFNITDKFSFMNETFNSSYRKIIDNKNYEIYNEYEINFDSLEERLTNLLLKNKKMLKDVIIEFIYNNENFIKKVSNIITTFNEKYPKEKLSMDDKVIIYNFYDENRSKDLYKRIIDDFMTLINFLVKREEENVMIFEMNSHIENNISQEFLKLFEDKKELSVKKITELFEYYLKLIFNDIKEDLEDYKTEFDDKKAEKKVKDELEKYFDNDEEISSKDKQRIINKNNLSGALRWFMCLVLFGEKEKNKKIKSSKKNLIDYLNAEDLWEKNIYKDTKFNKDLNELKKLNIQINKIIWLYDYLVKGEEEEDYIKEIEEYIEKKEENLESTNAINLAESNE